MTATKMGTPASVAEALRRVWPKYTSKIAAAVAGKSVRAGEEWVQGNKRGDWDTLIRFMAASDEMERHVLAMVRAEREKTLDAATGRRLGLGGAAPPRGAGVVGLDGGKPVAGHAPGGAPVVAHRAPEAVTPRVAARETSR